MEAARLICTVIRQKVNLGRDVVINGKDPTEEEKANIEAK